MKILLILAADLIYKYKNLFSLNNGFAPLSLTTLAASVPEKYNAEIKIIDEGMQKVNYDKLDFDVVGISCCASSSNRAYELAKYWKNRGAYTIIGGYHATLNPEDVSKYCDSVMCGFGENIFPQILEDYISGQIKKIYKPDCLTQLKGIIPRRDLIKNIPYMAKNTIFATRGCVNKCSYCSASKFTKSHLFKRSVNDVVDEIRNCGFKKVYFLDSNLIADKDYAKELLQALIPLKISYYADMTYDFYKDPELVDLMKKSGCWEIFVGFESFQEPNMLSTNKTNKINDYKQCINICHKNNIAVTGGFMLGMDYDTEESLEALPFYIDELGVDIVRYSLLTPLPGTDLFKQYETDNRLLIKNYDYYDFMHVVHIPKLIEPQKLQELFYEVWQNTYTPKRICKRAFQLHKNDIEIFLANIYFKYLGYKIPKTIVYKTMNQLS